MAGTMALSGSALGEREPHCAHEVLPALAAAYQGVRGFTVRLIPARPTDRFPHRA